MSRPAPGPENYSTRQSPSGPPLSTQNLVDAANTEVQALRAGTNTQAEYFGNRQAPSYRAKPHPTRRGNQISRVRETSDCWNRKMSNPDTRPGRTLFCRSHPGQRYDSRPLHSTANTSSRGTSAWTNTQDVAPGRLGAPVNSFASHPNTGADNIPRSISNSPHSGTSPHAS